MCGTTSSVRTLSITVAALCVAGLLVSPAAAGDELPDGYLAPTEAEAVLHKTLEVYLDPDLSHLHEAEHRAVALLVEAGERLQVLYEISRHIEARDAYAKLMRRHERRPTATTANLVELYRLFKGPTGRFLDGKRRVFLPVDEQARGGSLYPWGISRDEVDAYLAANPQERDELLDLRTVVKRRTRRNIERDLSTLRRHPQLAWLHPGLEARLRDLGRGYGRLYAVPYSVHFAEALLEVAGLLRRAADEVEVADVELARYLRQRAVDLMRDDYEAGDASWVTGRFQNLNVQVGAYETYDDGLYGVKAFFGMSILAEDPVMTSSLVTVSGWLQEFEDLLPYESKKRVRSDIPIGVYNVIADFGQARGTNTATILPNESYITRKYGRTILIRKNILQHPELFAERRRAFEAAVAEPFHDDYQPDGDLFRTLFHEIGHYLGPDVDRTGRTLDLALEEDASILEELKADLIALLLRKNLRKRGYYTPTRLRAVEASGIRRVLRKSEPRKSQVYATMQLMQMNYYLEKGLLEFDTESGRLQIDRARYHRAVEDMLREVLALQYAGDKDEADHFIDRYSTWDPDVHGRIAASMREGERYRYGLVRYRVLDGGRQVR